MAEARAYSASFHSVQAVADAALESRHGLALLYTVKDYGNLANAKHRARSFQKSFCSLRDRVRHLSRRRLGESSTVVPRVSDAKGVYDSLACYMEVMDDEEGYKIVLMNGHALLSHMNIIDLDSGKPLSEIGAARTEESRLIEAFTNAYFENFNAEPFGVEDCMRLIELDEKVADVVHAYMKGYRDSPAGRRAKAPIAPPIGPYAVKRDDITDILELGDAAFEGWEGADEGEKQTS